MAKHTQQAKPGLVFAEAVPRKLASGINTLVDAIAPTLGPYPRQVAFHEPLNGAVELLDSGGVIARRIVELPQRGPDVGAMFLRQVLWQLHENVGDGTATAAVLFRSIFNDSLRYLTAGGNPQILRRELENGLRCTLHALEAQTRPLQSQAELRALALSVSADAESAEDLAEIFEVIGAFGRLELRKGHRQHNEVAYQAGTYWDRGAMSAEMLAGSGGARVLLHDVAVLISDLDITEPHHIVPALAAAIQSGSQSLIIIANEINEQALAVLNANRAQARIQVYAVQTPEQHEEQLGALQDLAHLTGGKPYIQAAGDSLRQVTPADLGYARSGWIDQRTFGLIGTQGDPCELAGHIAGLAAAFAQADDHTTRRKLQARIGKLQGGTATLWLGSLTEADSERRKAQAERTARALRAALHGGVVVGGGAALLACQASLAEMCADTDNTARRAAANILSRALEAPLRTIATNAGYDAAQVLAWMTHAAHGIGFDVERGQIITTQDSHLLDVATVQQAALKAAVQSAALALTIDTIVHHRERDLVYQP